MKKIDNIKLAIGESEDKLLPKAAKLARVSVKDVKHFKILKKSLDARDKNALFYTYNVEISATEEVKKKREYPKSDGKVAVIGAGPCGLFCALYLARCGMQPTVFERGLSVDERKQKTDLFASGGVLDTECNIQFGEGGAGAFSDGKLNTQVNNELVKQVVEDFAAFGAPNEILYMSKPHIGSDKLPSVIKRMRQEIIALGGNFAFGAKVYDFVIDGGKLTAIKYLQNGREFEERFDETVLAIGHSSRDTFERLAHLNVKMEQKDFAVGFRVEHLQSEIGRAQYGEKYTLLPSADYRLASHAGARDVFTFCMCPGGYVMPAASEVGGVVVNGMSEYKRDGLNANSAIVCRVGQKDFIGDDALGGVRFQRELERKAFLYGGGDYKAPVQSVRDFLKKKNSSSFGAVKPTYPRGVTFAPLNEFFNAEITNSIADAIVDMGKKIKGFADGDGLFTAVESRTSSPLRILRDENCQSINVEGLYPAGEGAGYAGGITSAGADGIRVALAISQKHQI
ncbi:MAG: hypothetical protein SO373_07865 [Candidatus Borkfalkiaceae bacterium]|nr:hypothetical protein [Christensenellaceae bacterium]